MAPINRLSFVFFTLFCSVTTSRYADLGPLENVTREYFHTGVVTEELLTTLHSYSFPHLLRKNTGHTYDSPTLCYYCNLVVDLVIGERFLGLSRETLIEEVTVICTHLNIEDERVCRGAIEVNVDVFLYMIDNYPDLRSDRICGSVLQSSGCPTGDNFEWSIDIPPGYSPGRPKPDPEAQSFTILHFGDIHHDPDYTVGGNADCGEPLCCQSDQGDPATPEDACGYWSDYRNGDSPWHLVEEAVRQAKTQDVDYVYFSGDIISHRVWSTTVEKNTEVIRKVYTFLRDSFDVPVFPVFGNHEPSPLNVFPDTDVEGLSVNWLFEIAAELWPEMVGEDVSETVLKGGYYTVSPRPGFRIIGLNSNVASTENFWLIYDDVDPFGQLQWLADTLKTAEDNNESVHILSHVPTGPSSALHVWNREYSRIIDRFANIITAQLNGDSHKDEFHVFYNSTDSTQAIGVGINGASVTTYGDNNPSFKYYYVDESTFYLLDYDEWTFNLTLANSEDSTQTPEWYRLYSFVDAYGAASLIPTEVDGVVMRMTEDHSLLDDYFMFKVRDSDTGIRGGCDDNCRKGLLCDIVTTFYGQNEPCDRYLALYDQ